MSERKPSAFINDILTCIQHIQDYSSNLSFDQFSSNFMIVEACLYNIQVIGEAGMRNRLIHDYIGTDIELVWNVIKNDLPSFKENLEEIHALLINEER